MGKTILHIDMNAYFASCAQLAYPQYKGKPIAVGGKGSRSIITTASYEARKFGVKSAMPTYMAKRLCPQLIIVNPEFKLYEKYTNWFIEIIRKYATKIELASIDECYADITENLKKTSLAPLDYIKQIQDDILNTAGLPCSIGVGPNKFLAKMGSDYKKPMGLTVIRKHDIQQILWPIKIENMYGCGKKTSKMLRDEFGIYTIGDLAINQNPLLIKKLGKGYEVLHAWANGEGSDKVDEEIDDPKSIGNSHTLYFDTNNYEESKAELKALSDSVAKRAIRHNLYGNSVSLSIKYSDFTSVVREKTLDFPFNDAKTIFATALQLYDENYDTSLNLRLLGVTLRNVAPLANFVKQLSIFDKPSSNRVNSQTTAIINRINAKLGKNMVKTAAQVRGDKHGH